jgi:hypothetical protein
MLPISSILNKWSKHYRYSIKSISFELHAVMEIIQANLQYWNRWKQPIKINKAIAEIFLIRR